MSEVEIYESSWKLAQRVNRTPFVPKGMQGQPEAVLACVLYGRELGLGPMQALNSIHVIEGKATASPELMRALVAKAGHRIDVAENTNEVCVLKGKRIDTEAEATVRWSLDDARAANLTGKDNWKKYPRAMLVARATSELCRILFPDVIAGLSYTPEEIESVVNVPQPISITVYDTSDIPDEVLAPKEIITEQEEIVTTIEEVPVTLLDESLGETAEDIAEPELIDSQSLVERGLEIKRWGSWQRVRAIAMPIARGEGMEVPKTVDEFLNNHVLYTLVAAQMNKGR
jgi:hypothetical protein